MARRVVHLVGSAVSELYADLSRLYAADCLEATADPSRYEPVIAHVSPDRRWRFPESLERAAIDAAPALGLAEAAGRLADAELMVPQMFCVPGMTEYRALFDVLEVPYLGNRPDVMALTADKAKARAVVAAAGVAVPHGEVLRAGQRPTLDPPVVVKPVDADNSLGIALVRDVAEYDVALEAAFAHADAVLVERYVELGREVRVGTLVRDGELVCLPLEEYAVDGVRTHDDKLGRGAGGELKLMAKEQTRAWIVAGDDPIVDAVHELARTCHIALGCRHYGLFDVRVDPRGRPWFLEASLYCSFARQSVISVMAGAAGLPPLELFSTVVKESDRGA